MKRTKMKKLNGSTVNDYGFYSKRTDIALRNIEFWMELLKKKLKEEIRSKLSVMLVATL